MSEENVEEKDERYISKLNYPNLLNMRINDIHLSIIRNNYAKRETSNLLSTLLPKWIEEIKPKLDELMNERDNQLEQLEKVHGKVGTQTYYTDMGSIMHHYAWSVVNETIGLMHKYGMLLIKEKEVLEYYEK